MICVSDGAKRYLSSISYLREGTSLSSYIYHTLNLQPTSYIRKKFSIPMFLYIDDRLIEELRHSHLVGSINRALAANYIVCEILIRLGYCINNISPCSHLRSSQFFLVL